MSDNPYKAVQAAAFSSEIGGVDPKLDRSVNMLRQTKPWVRFMSVIMFIGSGFMILGGLVMMIAIPTMGGPNPVFGLALGFVYIAMALIYIMPALFLWRYADRIALFVQDSSTDSLGSALEAQKSFWKFVGILMIVVMVLYAVLIVFTIVGTVASI